MNLGEEGEGWLTCSHLDVTRRVLCRSPKNSDYSNGRNFYSTVFILAVACLLNKQVHIWHVYNLNYSTVQYYY
jgi:hypothetical protein